MKLDDFACKQLAQWLIEPTGSKLVDLFNQFGGFRDIYDSNNGGLPKIKEHQKLNTSKKMYVEDRLRKVKNNDNLPILLEHIIEASTNKDACAQKVNSIISALGFNVERIEDKYIITGTVIKKVNEVKNDAQFKDIQNKILVALGKAKLSIDVAVAWITNRALCDKLLEKQKEGVKVRIIINNDGINEKHCPDLSFFEHKKIRSIKGGIMHNKFCVIDNQIVITGSYNWTNNAEYKNEENINVTYDDNKLATNYSLKFRELWNCK